MWHRALLSLCCVILCGGCGNAAAQQLEKRWRLLETLGRDLRSIRSRVGFEGAPLTAILEALHQSPAHALWDAAREGLFCSESFATLWKKALSELHTSLLSPLKEEDIQLLLEFGCRLSEAQSVEMQLSQIDRTLERLGEYAKETKCEIQKKSRLFRTLGAMAGFAIMIVLW